MKRRISWSEIWPTDASRLKFLVFDVLPCPVNLFTRIIKQVSRLFFLVWALLLIVHT